MNQTTGGTSSQQQIHQEIDLVKRALRTLRGDLFTDAFAYRPMPQMRTDRPFVRFLPTGLRRHAGWAPHVVVCLLAFIVVVAGVVNGQPFNDGLNLGLGLIVALPVLMTLVRPIAAWWVSLGACVLAAVLDWGNGWPWVGASLFGYLLVMALVAARTGPRVAGWMWGVTLAYGILVSMVVDPSRSTNVPQVALGSGVLLILVSSLYIRRSAAARIIEEKQVTAVERYKRTLLEERTTIARELHDVVAHHMSVVAIQAEAAPYRVENPPPELEQAFLTIRENAVAALTELRRVLGVVRSADYEAPDAPQPTLASLDGLLANVREAGLEVEKTLTGARRDLPPGVELSAYRIVQEALSNSLRHAPGARASVEVSYVLGGLGLRVVNEAPTGDIVSSPGAGHGITGMRERVAMLSGDMTAGPTQDGGYEVAVFIPLARPEEPVGSGEEAA
ncbi:sensor histidine kinase [Streptomyces sp. NPDC006879]|uniref:sensor histidine kinase n=1 Tax=Streptomyces sp. NPDC006879 TaxID=3364767 RepID=UPI003695869E